MEITTESAKKAQKEAEWAYNKAMEKFYYSMLEVVFLRIKSHLSTEGLKKVVEIDKKRANNENLGVEFSQLYGLEISDLDISKIQKLDANDSSPKCTPSK